MRGRLTAVIFGLGLALGGLPALSDCAPRDFLAEDLPAPAADPAAQALGLAYPDLALADGVVTLPDGTRLPLGEDRDRAPARRLADASLREMFHDTYPLRFDLTARQKPWVDPGRARNEAFFLALYGSREAAVRATLVTVDGVSPDMPAFRLTETAGVACQFEAALHEIAALPVDWRPVFRDAAGSFLWRKIAGTDRLSAHSFGIAFDLNAEIGGYWRWSGRPEGDAGAYDNRIPPEIVGAFERRGFIWGGKWHHFDGMHFEYRPEIILYARLTGG